MSDVSKAHAELIAELRRSPSIDVQTVIDLMAQVADALEAATRVPAQGEPATGTLRADEMTAEEAIESVLKRPGMYGLVDKEDQRRMKAERDATTADIKFLERTREGWMARALETEESLKIARTERDAALAAIGRVKAVCAEQAEVRKFNLKIPFESSHLWKKEPNVNDVVAALDGGIDTSTAPEDYRPNCKCSETFDGTPEPAEMEFEYGYTGPSFVGVQESPSRESAELDLAIRKNNGAAEARLMYRKVGPWLSVDGESA